MLISHVPELLLLIFMPVIIGIELGLYLLPAIIAMRKRLERTFFVFVINTLFGWTVVGWIVCLVMVLKRDQPVMVPESTAAYPTGLLGGQSTH